MSFQLTPRDICSLCLNENVVFLINSHVGACKFSMHSVFPCSCFFGQLHRLSSITQWQWPFIALCHWPKDLIKNQFILLRQTDANDMLFQSRYFTVDQWPNWIAHFGRPWNALDPERGRWGRAANFYFVYLHAGPKLTSEASGPICRSSCHMCAVWVNNSRVPFY